MSKKSVFIKVGDEELEIIDKYNRMTKKEKEEFVEKNKDDPYLMTLVEISRMYN